MLVEAANPEDSRAIAEVHVASWHAAYASIVSADYLATLSVEHREASWKKQLLGGSPAVLVARDATRVVGFLAFGPCRDPEAPSHWGEIWALYVLPSHWSSGVGRALWLAALASLCSKGLNTITVWVMALNVRGIKFYIAAGFVAEPDSEKVFSLGDQELGEVRLIYQDASNLSMERTCSSGAGLLAAPARVER
jgi:ribosomal protein S18 acetylase RimI-like enzyme